MMNSSEPRPGWALLCTAFDAPTPHALRIRRDVLIVVDGRGMIDAVLERGDPRRAALEAATSGPVAEGSTGGGNGMIAYEFKGGTGTSSRRVPIGGQEYTVAALVQANHGIRPWLTILGRPVGRLMPEGALHPVPGARCRSHQEDRWGPAQRSR